MPDNVSRILVRTPFDWEPLLETPRAFRAQAVVIRERHMSLIVT